jgi:Protein of unknown function (DUF2804)
MAVQPTRGSAVRTLGLKLPPERMPAWRGGRPLKRWRYVGVYTPHVMLCVGDARIGPVPQRWWAVALPDGELRERTTFGRGGVTVSGSSVRVQARGVRIELELDESTGVEVASPVHEERPAHGRRPYPRRTGRRFRDGRPAARRHGAASGHAAGPYAWTRKQACVPVRGFVELDGERMPVDGEGAFIDDSAGYHARHTTWTWSAGVGTAADGRPVGWNLVSGIHDDPLTSERTLWIEGEPVAVGSATFAEDLSEIGFDGATLRFDEWSVREHSTNALLLRSRYRQPFGAFTGSLPGGLQLAEGFGVMEQHDVHW